MATFIPSATAWHAVRALSVLAAEPERWHRADEVEGRAAVPRPFLAKLLNALARKRVVMTRRGRHGGYRLAVAAQRFSLLDVIRVVDGDDVLDRCRLGAGRCSAHRQCPLHPYWSEERPRMLRRYRELTLERLASLEVWNLSVPSARHEANGPAR